MWHFHSIHEACLSDQDVPQPLHHCHCEFMLNKLWLQFTWCRLYKSDMSHEICVMDINKCVTRFLYCLHPKQHQLYITYCVNMYCIYIACVQMSGWREPHASASMESRTWHRELGGCAVEQWLFSCSLDMWLLIVNLFSSHLLFFQSSMPNPSHVSGGIIRESVLCKWQPIYKGRGLLLFRRSSSFPS